VYPAGGDQVARQRRRDTEAASQHSRAGIAAALEHVTLFSLCSKKELRLIAKLAHVKRVRSDTTLVVEGEPGDDMFVLLSGSAVVLRGGRKLASVGPGESVGELAILSRAPRNATVTTRTDCDVAVISRRHVQRMIEEAPGFSRKLLEALADRVRELDRRVVC
jgi:CRP/FNR family transcriptional regulator, cyclic AMP receptor protein